MYNKKVIRNSIPRKISVHISSIILRSIKGHQRYKLVIKEKIYEGILI